MEYVKLGDICTKVCSGGTPTSSNPAYYDGNIPWLNTNEVNFCNIYSTNKTISEEGLKKSAAKYVPENTVIVAMYGVTAGKCAIAKIPLTTNQACCNLIIDKEKADYCYVYYYLRQQSDSLNKLAIGGAQQNLNALTIKKFKIALPTLPIQKKIASILSTYDRLIENNTHRIRLLEQMAENLYKEWFVRFRFPEHEKVEMVNGLPKGWKVEKIKECVKRLPFGRTYKAKELSQDGEVIVIDQSTSDFLGFHNNTPDHHATFNSPIILFGDHSCKFCLMTRNFSLGENIIPFISKDTKQIDNYYLYFATHKLIVTEEYKRHWGRLSSMKILIPTIDIQQKFNKLIIKNEKMKKLLFIQNQLLTRQRDLLLPRLMSGKLEVKS
jgi:type I restriction-modification system specificity subunit